VGNKCVKCSSDFEVTKDDLVFYESVSPRIAGKKYGVPVPTHCPDCRQQRRLAICNERHLYADECGLCKEKTLTEFTPTVGQMVYCRDCWHSDKWDARDYGREFDFSRPFFEQIHELKKAAPAQALNTQGTNVNSDYIHMAGWSKNCYLIMHADYCEDCYYGYGFKKNLFCVDGFYNLHSELCYDCVDVHKCYGLTGCQDCVSCNSSAFLRDCIGCHDCFCCVGLRNQSYCFENEKLGKAEYEARMKKVDLGSYKQYCKWRDARRELELKHTFKEFQGNNLVNCFGDHLNHCKDLQYSFDCEDVEGGKFCYQLVLGAKNNYDIFQYGTNIQHSYECTISGGDSYHVLFGDNCHSDSVDLIYCWYMESCKNCFGCTNMQHNSYCVLNKQYSEKEYNELVPRIIEHMRETGEWGEFFPSEISPHGYNKSSAQMYYPLSKESALADGFWWDDYDPPAPEVPRVLEASDLSDNIKDIGDDVLEAAIKCEVSGKLFRLTKRELAFYRRVGLPLPRRCPEQRHLDRFALRNPRKFWDRECGRCSASIRATYEPSRPEIVYCEKCYMEVMY
jgi:hypothetical protein